MNAAELNDLSRKIIGAAIEVHSILGPGLLEEAYEAALCHELHLRNINAKRQVSLPVIYKGVEIKDPYRMDLLVDGEIVVELKATQENSPLYAKQLLTYLRLSGKKLGLLINFNHEVLKEGLTRVVNHL